MKSIDLAGSSVPALGFGTWRLTGAECTDAVRDALDIGYRHIDTAEMYENEAAVGQALADVGLPREDYWLTTKVWRDNLAPERVQRAAEASLKKLGVDYVDLLLIHWPNDDVPLFKTLDALVRLQEQGKTRHIGVSNFPARMLQQALEDGPVVCNQVEYHPFLGQDALLDIVREHDLMLTAYSPLGKGLVPANDTLSDIGRAHGKSAVQTALRWLLDQDRVAAIPRSSSSKHRRSNFDVFDFTLDEEQTARIDALPKDQRGVDPDFAPEW